MLDGIARAYQQALLLANGLQSDLLDSTLSDSRGDRIPDTPGAPLSRAIKPSSTFSAVQYPASRRPGAQRIKLSMLGPSGASTCSEV